MSQVESRSREAVIDEIKPEADVAEQSSAAEDADDNVDFDEELIEEAEQANLSDVLDQHRAVPLPEDERDV